MHDNSKNIDYHNNNDGDNDIILVTMLIRNQCQKHDVTQREGERESNEDNGNDIDKSASKHEKRKPKTTE